jgi:hypothetical protein
VKEAIVCVCTAYVAGANRRGREEQVSVLQRSPLSMSSEIQLFARLLCGSERRRERSEKVDQTGVGMSVEHGDARVKTSSKVSCLGKWSAVAGADEFEWGRTLEGEEEGRAGTW